MGLTGERTQLCNCLSATIWLGEQLTAQSERLIGTDNNGGGPLAGNGKCLLPCEDGGDLTGCRSTSRGLAMV